MDWEDRSGYDSDRYLTRKAELLALVDEVCETCGSVDRLEFDHVDPSTKTFSIMSRWNAPLSELLPELAKCRSLCHDCHSKSSTYGTRRVDHGGGKTGRRNCSCDPCKARKREYMRELRRQRALEKGALIPA